MKVGAIKNFTETETLRKVGARRFGSGSSASGGGDIPDGGGPDFPSFPADNPEDAVFVDKSKFIAWFLLLAVGMTFAGLLGAYLMIATNKAAEWQPFDLPVQVWVSTVIIVLSSITYGLAKRGVDGNLFLTARRWLGVTTIFGAAFISSQLILWLELVNRGLYMQGNPYAGFFYILTAAHLVHVLGGIAALSAIMLRSWYPAASEKEVTRRRDLARSIGWYWHFMGVLWIVLFLMLGFWK